MVGGRGAGVAPQGPAWPLSDRAKKMTLLGDGCRTGKTKVDQNESALKYCGLCLPCV